MIDPITLGATALGLAVLASRGRTQAASVPAPAPVRNLEQKSGESDDSYLYRRMKEEGGELLVRHSDESRSSVRLQTAMDKLLKCGCVKEIDVTEGYQRPHINPSTQNWDMKRDERSVATRYQIVK